MSTIIKEYGGLILSIIGGIFGLILLVSLATNWKVIGKGLAENITGTTIEYTETPAISAKPTAKDLVYNGKAQNLIDEGSSPDGTLYYRLESGSYSKSVPSAINAGTYTIYYYIKGDHNHFDTKEQSLSVTIRPAPSVIDKTPKVRPLLYTGKTQVLIEPGISSCGTLYYRLDNQKFSVDLPKATNLGEYKVYYYIKGDSNHEDSEEQFVTAKIKTEYTSEEIKDVYGGDTEHVRGEGTNAAGYSGSASASVTLGEGLWAYYTPSYSNGIYTSCNFGTPGVWYIGYGPKTLTATITWSNKNSYTHYCYIYYCKINTATVVTNPVAKDLTYTGKAQTLVTDGIASNGTMYYKLEDGTYSTSIPQATNVGSYKVYYKAIGDETHYESKENYVVVTIKKAPASISNDPTAKDLTYTGSVQTLVNAGSSNQGTLYYKVGNGLYRTSLPTAINAGKYTVSYYVEGTGNYTKSDVKTLSVTIKKAKASVTKAPTAKSLTYNGSAQALVNAGTASGGTLKYAVSGDSYSSSIPTRTNVGTYTVYYYTEGDSNHTNSDTGSVKVSIIDSAKPLLSTTVSIASTGYSNNGYGNGLNMSLPASSMRWASYMKLTYTFTYSDNVGVTGWYWGTTYPSSVSSVSWNAVTGNSVAKELNFPDSGTYYFAVRDAAGNIASKKCVVEFGERIMSYSSGTIANTNKLSKFAVCNCSGTPAITCTYDGHFIGYDLGPVLYNVNGANVSYTQSGTRSDCYVTYIFYE